MLMRFCRIFHALAKLCSFCLDGNAQTCTHCDWARSCENVSYAIWEQQWRRLACTSVQSDQHFCCWLFRLDVASIHIILSFKILASFCS